MLAASMKAALAAFACFLLVSFAAASKLKTAGRQRMHLTVEPSTGSACEFNVFPSPDATYDAQGRSSDADLINADDIGALHTALASDAQWQLGNVWEFRVKVTSGYGVPLHFGFPGGNSGNGSYLDFDVPANAADELIVVKGAVHATAENVRIEYLGSDPPAITDHSVTFTEICLRPQLCAEFDGCMPAYHYRIKDSGTGQSMSECCEPIYCKEELTAGCSPATQWLPFDDFDTRLGNDLPRCCVPQLCTADVCNSTTYKTRQGTGLLGSTASECCDHRYCHEDQTLCDPSHDLSRLPDYFDDGTARLGSTEEDCCNVMECAAFNCSASHGLWTERANPTGRGHTFYQCCDTLYCANFSCENNTKWGPKEDLPDEYLGSTHERCCAPRSCHDYTCSNSSLKLVSHSGDRLGSTDDECCEPRLCREYTCSSSSKYEKKPEVEEVTADGSSTRQFARPGFSDEECCEPKLCSVFHCTSTKWQKKSDTTGLLGSTFDECCDRKLCEYYNCTSDWDGVGYDGDGTMYYKRVDTNAFKWQGSTDEECCHPKYCTQYVTQLPSKWERKQDSAASPLLGSTDPQCYDPKWCNDFCGCKKGKKLIKDANNTQGSTVGECCEEIETTQSSSTS